MKKLLMLTLVCCLLLCSAALAEEYTAPAAITAQEILDQIDQYKEMALADSPAVVNSEEDADGVTRIFSYENGLNIYTSDETLTTDSSIDLIHVTGDTLTSVRDTKPGMKLNEVMQAFRSDNDGLAGTYQEAVVYTEGDAENGFSCSKVSRAGQNVLEILYCAAAPVEDGFLFCSLGFNMEDLTVSSLWLSSDKITKDEMAELYTVLHTSVNNDEYTAVIIDYTDGTGLDLFNEADLIFSGIDFLNNVIDPSVPILEEAVEPDGLGGQMHRLDGEGWSAVCKAEADGSNEKMTMFTILGDNFEGPRSVRIGDDIVNDTCRFRYEELEFDYTDMIQPLYGTVEDPAYGLTDYDTDGSATVRYALRTEDGDTVMLILYYKNMVLNEIVITRL